MKYIVEIEINKPIAEVIALFDNPDNLKHWMEGLQSFEALSGTPGEVGAKSKLIFLTGGRKLEMIETITAKNLPDEFSGSYEVNGISSTIVNRFAKVNENRTRYISESEYKLAGAMKILGWLMPGLFKKQSMKYLEAFKRFVEKQ